MPALQGKLGKAVRICYGHATVIFLRRIFEGLSQIAALVMLYISARDGVYTSYLYLDNLYPFPRIAEKDIFICGDVRKLLHINLSALILKNLFLI